MRRLRAWLKSRWIIEPHECEFAGDASMQYGYCIICGTSSV